MNNVPNWLKGFLRVFIVIFLIVYITKTVTLINDCNDEINTWLIPQINLEAASRHPLLSWCSLLASPKILSESKESKLRQAAMFFSTWIDSNVKDCCIDKETLREGFLNSATLSLDEAPIKIKRWSTGEISHYRDISEKVQYSGMKILKIIFYPSNIVQAISISFVSTATLIIAYFTIIWMYRGFKKQPRENIENKNEFTTNINLEAECSEYEKSLRDHRSVKHSVTKQDL